MNKFKPGDIVKARFESWQKYDFFHVVHAEPNGGLRCVGDWDGKYYRLSANYHRNEPATLAELVQHWEKNGRSKENSHV